MPMIDVLSGPGSRKVEAILRDTWGHLAAEPGRTYPGRVVICRTPSQDWNLLDYEFDGLDGNPWTHDHVTDWWSTLIDRLEGRGPADEICLWRWEGYYRQFKNGRVAFTAGKLIPLRIIDRFNSRRR